MAMSSEIPRPFRLYVTHVDGEGHFLKISGQLDQPSTLMLESLFEAARDNFEKGIGAVHPGAIHEGVICAAKYKDGIYYRAKVISTSSIAKGLVGVHFIDFGNKDTISLSTIRFLDNYDPMFLQLRGQATDYYLSRVINPSGKWEEQLLLRLQSLLCYSEYASTIDVQTPSVPLISIQFKGNDLATHLVTHRFGVAISLAKQEVLLIQMSAESNQQIPNWQPNYMSESPYAEHVPFLLNQNFPSNPASAMRLQQGITLPFNGSIPPPTSLISQRLLVNKVSRSTVNLRAPTRQPQHTPSLPTAAQPPETLPSPATHAVSSPVIPGPPPAIPVSNRLSMSPKKSATYKSRLLEVNSVQKVYVSFAEEGPELFAVQLAADADKLETMMAEINKRPHSSLKEPPMIGTVCLGRMSGDRIICRAIVTNLSGSQCRLFFVDFGDTEMVSYYDIFDIPEEFIKQNVLAMRFCLSGVKKLEKSPYLNETFKQLVAHKVVTLKVVPPEGPPLIQYGEMHLENNMNVLDLLVANMKEKVQFKWMEMLPLGSRQSILVSYVDSCVKYYVQLSDNIDDLNAVMDAVKAHCEATQSPGELPVGAACCARFPEDGNWYRARVRDVKGSNVVVSYVDYGNEQEVNISDLRTITPKLIRLPAQAMKCALKGFENKPVESTTSNLLEMLALEKTLMAQIVGVLSSDTMLMTLVDDSVSPALDIARKMNQLSQPRASHEIKASPPHRKEGPDTISSPEGSVDERKKSFRREKSFKDDRRPPRENEDFQRGGSFRQRDNNFDRSGPGRHSDKFGGRQDRGDRSDRRGGPKPWENNSSPPASQPTSLPADDWEETPSQSAPQPKFNRDNRDNRRKPRPEQDKGRPTWKKDSAVGKRLRQAAEAASSDTQQAYRGASVQDRLKRDKFNNQSEDRNDEWGSRGGRENRPERERRDFRSDRRENNNWGEKKDFQKRDFGNRDNREWGDKPKSNFNPRDRADRADKSFGSDKSDRSYKSQDNNRVGRGTAFKPRSKFTAVQSKELADPIPLETEFAEPTVELGAQHEVSVTWIISPDSFYAQILSLQPKFLEMMHTIPELYRGVKPFSGEIPVGASILARYPADGVLYRATVVAVQPFSKFIVRYVDFGNKQLVDARDIWQLDGSLMELPKMAFHCSLIGVAPKDGEWKASDKEIDVCFNAPRFQCVFQEGLEDRYKVSLWNNGVSVADMLVEKQLCVLSEHQSSVTLKDEPIDMTIIVGQQILCRVTYVESFEKFYVQLDVDKADLVEQTIADFDVAKLTSLDSELITEGAHCTVKHDGKIYRAILQDVSDSANVKAVLPDFGNSITTTTENLMILPTELSVYYYQSLQCSLNNYSAESETLMSLDELKAKLNGNKFIVYINDVDGVVLVTTLYTCATGEKVSVFSPDPGAYDEVVPLCMRAVFNYNFGLAYISHAENLNEFYLQRAADGDRIAQLLDDLYKFYEEGTPEPLTTFEADTLCAAKSSDGNWYRANILSSEETEVRLQFADYGNSETVAKDSVKKLDATFHEPCAQALVASLGLLALQDAALPRLVEWTTEKEVQVTLSSGSDGWLASLHLDGADLAHRLIEEGLASPRPHDAPEAAPEPPVAPAEAPAPPAAPPAGSVPAYVSHVDTPGHFWLQLGDKVDAIEEVQAELASNADGYPELSSRELGVVCCARYLADERWYRAEILDSDPDITTVRFLDYGNTDVLDNAPGLLKELPETLAKLERYAVKSSVNAVPTGTGEWSEAATERFTELLGDFSEPLDAIVVLKDVTTYVDLYRNGCDVTESLVADGHAARSDPAPDTGALPSCFASHVNSPAEFWIQLETATVDLQAMEAAMVDAANFPALTSREEGALCAALYPEDGLWYRAQLVVDGSEGTEVLFMDYGNASIADELRSLPDDLKTKPPLSRKCALQKPRGVRAWSCKSELRFNELAAEGATVFNVQFIASGDISIVELYLEGRSVTEELVALEDESPVVAFTGERPTPVGQGNSTRAKLCYVHSVDELYLNFEESLSEVARISTVLDTATEFESIGELKAGTVCAAFWSEDERWYRAKVLEFCDVGAHVQFLDYGNKARCEEFRELPSELSSLQSLAKCCRLAGAPTDQPAQDLARDKLDELALEDITFRVEILDSTKDPMLVELYVDDKNVTSLFNAVVDDIPEETLREDQVSTPEPKESLPIDTGDIEAKESESIPIDNKIDDIGTKEQESILIDNKSDDIETKESESNPIETKESETDHTDKDKGDIDTKESDNPTAMPDEAGDSKLEVVPTETINESAKAEDDSATEQLKESEPIEKESEGSKDKEEIVEADAASAQADLNESFESSHTVIENKSFEGKSDTLSDDIPFEDCEKDVTASPEKDASTETLENSNDTMKTPERDESKESIATDTGYTSSLDKSFDKDAESEAPNAQKPVSPKKALVVSETKETDPVIPPTTNQENPKAIDEEIPKTAETEKAKETEQEVPKKAESEKEIPKTTETEQQAIPKTTETEREVPKTSEADP